jgi:hypothetical protein
MARNKKPEQKKSALLWAGAFILISLLGAASESLDSSVFPVIFGVLFVALIAAAVFGALRRAAGAASEASWKSQRAAQSVPLRLFGKKEEDCDYGEVNHRYSHDTQRRLKQLDGFLKSGLIDREEYRALYRKYTQESGE